MTDEGRHCRMTVVCTATCLIFFWPTLSVYRVSFPASIKIIVVQYELYELYDWGKVPELYSGHGTLWNFNEF